MSKKKSIFDEEENELEEKEESIFSDSLFAPNLAPKSKKTKGKIINITPTKVYIEYGDGLGTFIIFEQSKHSNLKKGDPIEF